MGDYDGNCGKYVDVKETMNVVLLAIITQMINQRIYSTVYVVML